MHNYVYLVVHDVGNLLISLPFGDDSCQPSIYSDFGNYMWHWVYHMISSDYEP